MKKQKYHDAKPKSEKKSKKSQNTASKVKKKKHEKLTAWEFAEMNSIEWIPFDPYGD